MHFGNELQLYIGYLAKSEEDTQNSSSSET